MAKKQPKNKAHILSKTSKALRLKEKAQLEISQNKEETMNSIKGRCRPNQAGKLLANSWTLNI